MADPKWVDLPLIVDYEAAILQPGATNLASGSGSSNFFVPTVPLKSRLFNYIPVKTGGQFTLRPRESMGRDSIGFFDKGIAVSAPRGIFWIDPLGYLLELWDSSLFVWTGVADTYRTTTGMGLSSTGPGGFTSGIDSTGADFAFVSTVGRSVIVYSGSDVIVTDSDFPASIVPTPVFLDGYVFVAQLGTRKIYNSNVGDPTSWQASTFILAEQYGGNIVALARQKNYIVALCENHVEYFVDAGIPSPNSPLIRVADKTIKYGCINRATVSVHGDIIYFAGRDPTGQFGIFSLDDGQIQKISNPTIDFWLTIFGGSAGVFGNITSWVYSATSTGFATSYITVMYGKPVLFLVPDAGRASISGSTATGGPSFMYDFESKIWTQVSSTLQTTTGSNNTATVWCYPFSTYVTSDISNGSFIKATFQTAYGGSGDQSLTFLSSTSGSGEIVKQAGGLDTIAVTSAPLIYQSHLMDFGTADTKILSGLEVTSIISHQSGTPSNPFINLGSTLTKFVRYGSYTGATVVSNVYSYSLDPALAYTPPEGNAVWTLRSNLGKFNQSWFGLETALHQGLSPSSIRLRISTTHDGGTT